MRKKVASSEVYHLPIKVNNTRNIIREIFIFTFNFCLNDSGKTAPLILARFSSIFKASSSRPLASSHLGDSGRNLRAKSPRDKNTYRMITYYVIT